MVKISPELVYNKIKEDNYPFWSVTDGVNTYGSNFSEEEPNKSIQRLKSTLEEIEGETVTVTIKDKTQQQGNPRYERQLGRIKEQVFLVRLEPKKRTSTPIKETISDSFFSNNELKNFFFENQDLKLQIQGLKRDLAELQKLNEELEAELNEVEEVEETETIAGLPKEMVQNAVLGILGLTQKQNSTQPINGIEVETTAPESKTEKLKSILHRIKAVDNNYLENLETLAKFMEQQPAQYFSFLPTMKGLTK